MASLLGRSIWVTALVFFLNFGSLVLSCHEHELKVTYLGNCKGEEGKNNVIKNRNLTASVTSKCKLKMKGCFEVKTKVEKLQMEWKFKMGGHEKLRGREDICKFFQKPEVQDKAKEYSKVPNKCPFSKNTYCIGERTEEMPWLQASHVKRLAGEVSMIGIFTHNDGEGTSCLQADGIISPKIKKRA